MYLLLIFPVALLTIESIGTLALKGSTDICADALIQTRIWVGAVIDFVACSGVISAISFKVDTTGSLFLK